MSSGGLAGSWALVTIIVGLVFHSGPAELEACLSSISSSADVDVVVLDVSPDASATSVVGSHDGVTWMDGSRNAGYAWGLRQIADEWLAPGDTFIGSNADVRFLAQAIDGLVSDANALRGVCYPLQIDETGRAASYNLHAQLRLSDSLARWWGIGRRRVRRRLERTVRQAERSGQPVRIPQGVCASGAVIAMTQHEWALTGGLDPRFFLFSEDRYLGTTLERLGVPAFLCGDARVVHRGGFRQRGTTGFATTEALVSEQLYWQDVMRMPVAILVAIQVCGLLIRVVASALPWRAATREAYWTALRYRVTHLSSRSAAPFGPDGFRLPALVSRQREQL